VSGQDNLHRPGLSARRSSGAVYRPAAACGGYDRARQNLDRHPNYVLAALMASDT